MDLKRQAYSIAEAAEIIGVCRATLYNAAARGEIHVTKLLGRTLVPATELERITTPPPAGGAA